MILLEFEQQTLGIIRPGSGVFKGGTQNQAKVLAKNQYPQRELLYLHILCIDKVQWRVDKKCQNQSQRRNFN